MSQNNYKLGIVEYLLRKENHIRGLAKELHTNQTTISRKILELYNENVVDYKQEGRNKVFLLKKTFEAKQQACVVELYKQISIIKKYPRLRLVFERIKQNKDIALAILFGSYAKGIATKESDIDIYIDTNRKSVKSEAELIDTKINAKIGNYNKNSLLIKEIEKNHVIIKGVEQYYEKNQFFC